MITQIIPANRMKPISCPPCGEVPEDNYLSHVYEITKNYRGDHDVLISKVKYQLMKGVKK